MAFGTPVSITRPASVPADAGVVAEAGHHVVDVVLGLDQPLAGVERLGAGEVGSGRGLIRSAVRASSWPRSRSGVPGQGPSSNARRAATIAFTVSARLPSDTTATTEPSAGTTDLAAAPVHGIDATHRSRRARQRLHPSGRNAENPCCRCSWRIEMLLVQQNGRVARRLSTLWTQVGMVADRWVDAGVRTARTPAADLLTGAARSPTLLRITQRVVHDASRRSHVPSSRARPRVHPHVVLSRHAPASSTP